MSESKLVPNIRFKGFFDEWKRIKFLNCLTKIIDYRGRTPKKLGLKWCADGKYRALSALNVKNGYIDKNNDVHFGDFDLYKKWMGKAELKKGDILFTTEAPMGNVAIISDNEKYILSQRTIAFRVDQKLFNNLFLSYILRTTTVNNKLKSLSTGGTAQGVSQKSLSYLALRVTNNVDEQQKIGDLFAKLDRLLDLQQQKLDQLELLKKTLLQKLFPKQDAKIPELRFKGFVEEWKIKKFKDLFDHLSGTSIENFFNEKGKYKVISIGSYGKNSKYIDQGIRVDLNPVTKSHIVNENDLTMVLNDKTKDGQIIGRALLIDKNNEYVINQRTERLIPKCIDSNFAFVYLNGPFRKVVKRMVQGGTQIYINYSAIEKQNIIVPKRLKEEMKLGNLFAKVDRLIELENKKFSNLKQVKKSLLQNMFVE